MHWETKKFIWFYCNIHFIIVVWNRTHSIFETGLYWFWCCAPPYNYEHHGWEEEGNAHKLRYKQDVPPCPSDSSYLLVNWESEHTLTWPHHITSDSKNLNWVKFKQNPKVFLSSTFPRQIDTGLRNVASINERKSYLLGARRETTGAA